MCRIFSQVLNLPSKEIGATDSFFDLGGQSSLQAAQIVLLAKHEGFELNTAGVDHPTVRDLVQC